MNVFISYSSKDRDFVLRLYESLRLAKLEVFFDEKELRVGDDIPASLEAALTNATTVIYVMSSSSLKSKWVREELSIAKMRTASEEGLRILPVLIEDVDIPTGVSHIKYADFRNWENTEFYFKSLSVLFLGLGITPITPEPGVSTFAIENYELLSSCNLASRRLFVAIESLIDGYHIAQGYSGIDGLAKQAWDDAVVLGLPTMLASLQIKIDGGEGEIFSSTAKSVGKAISAIEKLKEMRVISSSADMNEFYELKWAFSSTASLTGKFIETVTLHALALLRIG